MNCANPDCSNVVPEEGRVAVNTRFCWDLPTTILVVCSLDCVEPALESLKSCIQPGGGVDSPKG